MSKISRRDFVKLMGAGGALSAFGLAGCETAPTKASSTTPAKAAPRVVVVGGGFGGATCAKYLRLYEPELNITLVEQNANYVTCPGSNWMLGGLRKIEDLTQNYNALRDKHGVNVVIDRVVGVDAGKRLVALASGKTLAYDRLVMSPGIDFRWGEIEGYDEGASQLMPHAWKAGPQTVLLQKQLHAMPDGGTFIMAAPPMPFRCPPGPPERASMVAHYFKTHKPKSKILILDAKDNFSKQALFMQAWEQFYPGMIEWVPATGGGKVVRVDPKTGTVYTANGSSEKGEVINIIPAQRAPTLAANAGLVNDSGWCPVNQSTFESTRVPNVHVIGDSSNAGAVPKSGHTANNIAKMTAAAIVSLFRGVPPPQPSHVNTCYSLVSPDYGISIAAVYRLGEDGQLQGVKGAGGLSPENASAQQRSQEAGYAAAWHKGIVADSFG
ncbi:MAG: NAD(P)/FAD-dependent oxidoreductase [Thiobacillus sp.]|nr:NAD(P)/FAD-dependent oxidoreductase [Thiobacillus sp.]MDP2978567.1 NAD(P)/FAD-dependent oxidoreductase [Thiobacillus sp.]